jgi:hypothetical protein
MKRKKVVAAILVAGMLVSCTPSQEQQWLQLVGVLVSEVPNILPLLTGNPQAESAAKQTASDYQLAQSLLQQYQANSSSATTTLGKVSVALSEAQTNLDAILTATQVSNATTQTKIQAAVNLAITVTQDLVADLPTSTGKATVAHVILPKPSDVENQFNAIFAR